MTDGAPWHENAVIRHDLIGVEVGLNFLIMVFARVAGGPEVQVLEQRCVGLLAELVEELFLGWEAAHLGNHPVFKVQVLVVKVVVRHAGRDLVRNQVL